MTSQIDQLDGQMRLFADDFPWADLQLELDRPQINDVPLQPDTTEKESPRDFRVVMMNRLNEIRPRVRSVGRSSPVWGNETRPVSAPTDDEVYGYFGPQQRWVQITMTLSFALAGISLFKFAQHAPWLKIFWLVLLINASGAVFSAISGWNRRRMSADEHLQFVTRWTPVRTPSIDVFLPSCGEPLDVLRNTYDHVARMQWDGQLVVWVLDDAAKSEVQSLAEEFGFRYATRPNRGEMKKAGNLLFGMGLSNGEHIVIFDADFCPRDDFLYHVIPSMEDPSIGIVQSPQLFDTSSSMSWLQRTSGSTQELFYRWVQPSRDAAGAPICVGTNAVYRRSALEEVGGFAQIEHSEDVHTGILLMRAGFTTRYVPISIAKGLCPDDMAGFLSQQYRWCNGSITLLRSGQAQRHPLTVRQRLCFWAGFMYYIATAVNVFTVHIPGIIMAFKYPEFVRVEDYVPFLAGVWVYAVLLPRVFRTNWRFEVLRVQMAYSFAHSMAIWHKLRGRTAGWVPTGAIGSSNALARSIAKLGLVWLTVSLSLSWIGVVLGVVGYGMAKFWPMTLFLLGYTYLSVPLVASFYRVLRPRTPMPAKVTAETFAESGLAAPSVNSPVEADVVVDLREVASPPQQVIDLRESSVNATRAGDVEALVPIQRSLGDERIASTSVNLGLSEGRMQGEDVSVLAATELGQFQSLHASEGLSQ